MTHPPRKFDPSARRPPTIPYSGGSAPIPAAAVNAPPAPAPPPRPVTPAANRRSWTEPLVRFWILATAVLVGIGGWFVTGQFLDARRELWLINNGTTITDAIALDSNGDDLHPIAVGAPVTIKFDWQGQPMIVHGVLTRQTTAIMPRKPLPFPLHVNPNDPTDWTDRKEPESLVHRLIAGTVIIPAALITALAAIFLRQRVLRVWREGPSFLYTVVDTRYSALAPLSHSVRCVVSTGRDSTIITVHLPTKLPRPQHGEVLWLIHPQGKPKAAIAARAFE